MINDIYFDFTAHKNMILIRDSDDAYFYNAENKELKHFALDAYIDIDRIMFFKGKVIGMTPYPQNGIIYFFELNLNDGSLEHKSQVYLPELSVNNQDRFEFDSARHFAHNEEFFVELPPGPDTNTRHCPYVNVDFKSNCIKTCRIELYDLHGRDFLSLPSWLLL